VKKSDTFTSVILLGFAAGSVYESLKLPFGRVNAPAPGFFPTILSTLLLLTSVVVLWSALRESETRGERSEPIGLTKIFWNLGALIAFTLLLERLGFLVTTVLFLIFLLGLVERKSWGIALGVALGAAAASYIILKHLLGIPLPAGFFEL